MVIEQNILKTLLISRSSINMSDIKQSGCPNLGALTYEGVYVAPPQGD